MTSNDIAILNSILDAKKREYSPEISDSDFFELFIIEQTLKKYDLTNEEIEEGNVGDRGDGQIDGFFSFLNGELLQEDRDVSRIKRDPKFEIFIIQGKTTPSFQERIVERVTATVKNTFDLSTNAGDLRLYNSQLVEKIELFKKYYKELTVKHPTISITFIYATKGDTDNIHPNVLANADILKTTIKNTFRDGTVEIKFFGSKELIELFNQRKEYTLQIQYHESYISTAANNYIILSNLVDFYKFVTDDAEQLQKHIFDANVRDYQGDVEVNQDIYQTLESIEGDFDFWWLNNGITILATNATIHGKIITLDNVQIVNGLQTTMEIWKYLNNKHNLTDSKDKQRSLLIRIIVTEDAEIRDRIIKATNFQTRIPPPSLRATDPIQRRIETYFLTKDWYYDRRKNYYKNIGKPASRIIDIPLLSQILMAIVLKEPFQARSRPTAIIKSEEDYSKLFNDEISPEIYLLCSKIIKIIESSIRTKFFQHPLSHKASFKFHVAMVLMMRLTRTKTYSIQDLSLNLQDAITDNLLEECFNFTITSANSFAQESSWDLNRISKSREFNNHLIETLSI
jgi:hypothetical protein